MRVLFARGVLFVHKTFVEFFRWKILLFVIFIFTQCVCVCVIEQERSVSFSSHNPQLRSKALYCMCVCYVKYADVMPYHEHIHSEFHYM